MSRSCTLCLVVCRADYHCFQIELSKNYGVPEWREDVKTCLLKAGLQNLPVVFLFTDTQVCANDRYILYTYGCIRENSKNCLLMNEHDPENTVTLYVYRLTLTQSS